MAHRIRKKRVSASVRKKISQSLKKFYKLKKQSDRLRARDGFASWMPAAKRREEKFLAQARERIRRSEIARKGWATRRQAEEEVAREKDRRRRQRRIAQREVEEKEARRLAKWRKSYKKYLEFRVPKKEREELETPAKKELVCRVLFDSDVLEDRVEHFWTNLRELIGNSIAHYLNAVPAVEGIVRMMFKLISGDEFKEMQAGEMEDVFDFGELIPLEWESEFDLEPFWSNYYEQARSLLGNKEDQKTPKYQASVLLVVRVEVCYEPGTV